MKRTLLLTLIGLVPLFLSAQKRPPKISVASYSTVESVRWEETGNALSFARFSEGKGPLKAELFSENLSWLPEGIQASDLVLLRSFEDLLGMRHTRYQVTKNGVPVEGAIVLLHEKKGRVESFNGDGFRGIRFANQAGTPLYSISATYAEGKAIEFLAQNNRIVPQGHFSASPIAKSSASLPPKCFAPTLVYAPVNGDFEASDFRLAWKVCHYQEAPLIHSWLYVDAVSGEVIWERDRIHTVDVPGIARTKYSGTQNVTTDSVGPNSFRLRETGRGGGIYTLNLNGATQQAFAVDFLDQDNDWNNVNASQDEVATDAHWGAELAYDYFSQTYNWRSYDNQDAAIFAYVHYDSSSANAFWDGFSMFFGDGTPNSSVTSPLTDLEILGHEFTHGIVQHSADFSNTGEPAFLNESFCDIFGTILESQGRPNNWNWIVGDQVTANGMGIRNLEDPKIHDQPDTYLGEHWTIPIDVWLGPHHYSTVQGKWFQLLTAGGSGTNDLGDSYAVNGIGLTASAAIAFRTLTVYLSPTSNYADSRFYSIQAARDLFGDCSPEMTETIHAWYAVGVGREWTTPPTAGFDTRWTRYCEAPFTVAFQDRSSTVSGYHWDFGDGATDSVPNPVHTYSSYGNYTVKLIVTDCAGGKDTLIYPDYIQADPSQICPEIMVNGRTIFNTCNGTLMDPGGAGLYPAHRQDTFRIFGGNNTRLSLDLREFEIDGRGDGLRIFDGASTSAPELGFYSGLIPPTRTRITTSGQAVTLVFQSDGTISGAGFEIDWVCLRNNSAPLADFITTPLFTCDGTVSFSDHSEGNPTSWNWDFGDGGTSNQANPIHTYASAGFYDVSLVVCNANGCDTLTHTREVTVQPQALLCDTALLPFWVTDTLLDCRGVLMDDGGTGNYSASYSGGVLIAPPGARSLLLTFHSFDMDSNGYVMVVSDGQVIRLGSGTNFLNGGRIFSPGGTALVTLFDIDQTAGPGFSLEWEAYGVTGGPVAAIGAPVATEVGIPVSFSNLSQNSTHGFWELGDGTTTTDLNPTHTYAAPGTYAVVLFALDSSGCVDSSLHTLIVNSPPVGREELSASSELLKVWPNPASEVIHVVFRGEKSSALEVSLLDVWGRSLWQKSASAAKEHTFEIPTTSIARGIYLLRLESAQSRMVRKLILR